MSQSSGSTADDFRVVINRYWSFVRRYPSSGFADNALWQAATSRPTRSSGSARIATSTALFSCFNGCGISIRTARFKPRSQAQIEQLETMTAAAGAGRSASSGAGNTDSMIRAVQRQVLPDVVRVTIELDREVPFYQERLEGPARLFFDLKGTRTVAALVDATFRYDSDIVRHIRLGRHPNNTTRIVLDLENVGRYSVFTLYNPYRIVIDAERSAARSCP